MSAQAADVATIELHWGAYGWQQFDVFDSATSSATGMTVCSAEQKTIHCEERTVVMLATEVNSIVAAFAQGLVRVREDGVAYQVHRLQQSERITIGTRFPGIEIAYVRPD